MPTTESDFSDEFSVEKTQPEKVVRAAAKARAKKKVQVEAKKVADADEAVRPPDVLKDYQLKEGENPPLHVLNALAMQSRDFLRDESNAAATAAFKAVNETLGVSPTERKINRRFDNAAKASARLIASSRK